MTPVKQLGEWFVKDGEWTFGPFATNAEAWRFIDKRSNENHNAKEARHEWSADQNLKSEWGLENGET